MNRISVNHSDSRNVALTEGRAAHGAATSQPGLRNLAWMLVRNEDDTEVSIAYSGGIAYRRRLNLQSGRALYARASRIDASEVEWTAVDANSGGPLVGYVP